MTTTERLQITIGRLVVENATMATKIETLEWHIRELEKHLAETAESQKPKEVKKIA